MIKVRTAGFILIAMLAVALTAVLLAYVNPLRFGSGRHAAPLLFTLVQFVLSLAPIALVIYAVVALHRIHARISAIAEEVAAIRQRVEAPR